MYSADFCFIHTILLPLRIISTYIFMCAYSRIVPSLYFVYAPRTYVWWEGGLYFIKECSLDKGGLLCCALVYYKRYASHHCIYMLSMRPTYFYVYHVSALNKRILKNRTPACHKMDCSDATKNEDMRGKINIQFLVSFRDRVPISGGGGGGAYMAGVRLGHHYIYMRNRSPGKKKNYWSASRL